MANEVDLDEMGDSDEYGGMVSHSHPVGIRVRASSPVHYGRAKAAPRWKQLTEDTSPSDVTVTRADGSVEVVPADE